MSPSDQIFFSAALSAGAILTGFCGTFLSFRIQREVSYHRQVALDFNSGKAKDVFVGLTHFSSGFAILIGATVVIMASGFVLPLLALSGFWENWITPGIVCGGLLSGLVMICGYFWIELVHYDIISNRLLNDSSEWGRELKSLVVSVIIAVGIFGLVAFL